MGGNPCRSTPNRKIFLGEEWNMSEKRQFLALLCYKGDRLACFSWKMRPSIFPAPSIVREFADLQSKTHRSISSDLPVFPHPCLIVPSQIQHSLSRQKACWNWSENTHGLWMFFVMLSHSYFALPYLCVSSPIFTLLVRFDETAERLSWAPVLRGFSVAQQHCGSALCWGHTNDFLPPERSLSNPFRCAEGVYRTANQQVQDEI